MNFLDLEGEKLRLTESDKGYVWWEGQRGVGMERVRRIESTTDGENCKNPQRELK